MGRAEALIKLIGSLTTHEQIACAMEFVQELDPTQRADARILQAVARKVRALGSNVVTVKDSDMEFEVLADTE